MVEPYIFPISEWRLLSNAHGYLEAFARDCSVNFFSNSSSEAKVTSELSGEKLLHYFYMIDSGFEGEMIYYNSNLSKIYNNFLLLI